MPDAEADGLRDEHGRRAAMLVYLTLDVDLDTWPAPGSTVKKNDVVPLLSLVAPARSTPAGRSVLEWKVRGRKGEVTVEQQSS